MTFDQLSKVRQDGIVDDDIVFRALWQREAFERLLIPSMRDDQTDEERRAALDDYFDVGDANDHRRQLLLGTPRYRFCTAVPMTKLGVENGWTLELEKLEQAMAEDSEEEEEVVDKQARKSSDIWQQTFYSQTEAIWGTTYRVRVEAQVIPDNLVRLEDDSEAEDGEPKKRRCSAPSQFTSDVAPKQPRIRYTIHCLNQREAVVDQRRVDPEDRMLVAVTDHTDGGSEASNYVGQIRIDGYNPDMDMTIDVVVCLEVPGFSNSLTQ
ncbi:hypothetical protein BJV82DRAFT_562867 [Fennellomyces sp. T-0311]|nr:hypothetical protein BJV82DRAFT_562867 [Fennellomyces sp. T-0311]